MPFTAMASDPLLAYGLCACTKPLSVTVALNLPATKLKLRPLLQVPPRATPLLPLQHSSSIRIRTSPAGNVFWRGALVVVLARLKAWAASGAVLRPSIGGD